MQATANYSELLASAGPEDRQAVIILTYHRAAIIKIGIYSVLNILKMKFVLLRDIYLVKSPKNH